MGKDRKIGFTQLTILCEFDLKGNEGNDSHIM